MQYVPEAAISGALNTFKTTKKCVVFFVSKKYRKVFNFFDGYNMF